MLKFTTHITKSQHNSIKLCFAICSHLRFWQSVYARKQIVWLHVHIYHFKIQRQSCYIMLFSTNNHLIRTYFNVSEFRASVHAPMDSKHSFTLFYGASRIRHTNIKPILYYVHPPPPNYTVRRYWRVFYYDVKTYKEMQDKFSKIKLQKIIILNLPKIVNSDSLSIGCYKPTKYLWYNFVSEMHWSALAICGQIFINW